MYQPLPRDHVAICFFFFNDTATTEIYTLSLHDALPISEPLESIDAARPQHELGALRGEAACARRADPRARAGDERSEEHTSELQSQSNLVCRLLLEKKKRNHRPLLLSLSLDCRAAYLKT